jgi:hypothetical protein
MVSKHKNIPTKLKYVRGGAGLGDLFKEWAEYEEKIKEWAELVVSDIKKSLGNNDDETYGSNMSEEDIEKLVAQFRLKIVKRGDNFRQKRADDEKTCKNNKDGGDISKLYKDFDTIFLSILTKIKNNINQQSPNIISEKFEEIINTLKPIPRIEENLETIVDNNISSFKARFDKIIDLLKQECGGFKSFMCSAVVHGITASIGKNTIKDLYDSLFKLKKNKICDEDLIKFIKDVIPIIQENLAEVTEFEDNLKDLETANKELLKVSVGGKKSSRAGRKEIHGKQKKIYVKSNYKNKDKDIVAKTSDKPVIIAKKIILGKERCIYKIQGSKREHVKYKGSIITVTDYKKLMKVL